MTADLKGGDEAAPGGDDRARPRPRPRLRWPVVAATTAARRTLADPNGLLATGIFYLIATGVVGSLWRAAAAGAPGGELVGYDARAFTWYIAISEVAMMALPFRMVELIGDDIASGAVASDMLRPAPVVGVRIATSVGGALPRVAVLAAFGSLMSMLVVGAPASAAGLALAVPSLVLAVLVNVAGQHAVAAASFWLRDAKSTWFVYQKLILVLGGVLLPLQVMPEWLERVAAALPFAAMAYAPARLASGHVEPELLLVQAAWGVVMVAAAAWVFGAGERRLQAVGG
jgi:ABC-2 type transport system permease protein